jgi:hypothetical protein
MFGWLTITRNPDCLKYRLYKTTSRLGEPVFATSSKYALKLYLDMAGLCLNFRKSRTMFQKNYFVGGHDQSTGCIQVDESMDQDD